MPHSLRVCTPSQWPGHRTVFSANSLSCGRVKMKLGMPGRDRALERFGLAELVEDELLAPRRRVDLDDLAVLAERRP